MKDIYLLMGFGLSNKHTFKFLKNLRKKILIYDDNPNVTIPALYKINESKIPYTHIKQVIVSPGIPPNNPMILKFIEKGVEIITALDLLYLYNQRRKKKAYYIGVTGSNGKTTTVTLIHQLLKHLNLNHILCGNIGFSPFTDIKNKHNNIYIIELSSFQLHYIKYLQLDIGLIINIASNHDKWHGSFSSYKEAKLSIQKRSKIFIYENQGPMNPWSIVENILYFNQKRQWAITNLVFTWPHNQINLLNALLILMLIGAHYNKHFLEILGTGLNKLQTPIYRQEIIYNKSFLVINDSKSTSMCSTKTALDNFSRIKNSKIILLVGGLLKGDIMGLLTDMNRRVEKILLFGASSRDKTVRNIIQDNNIYSTLKDAINEILWKQLGPEYIILFSPGGASYDEFTNYEERGAFFTESIKKILSN